MSSPTNAAGIQTLLSKERYLDMPVGEYHPKVIGTKLDLGTASVFREYYKQNLQTEPGKVVFDNMVITTTPEVVAVLRALLYTGCCRIEQRSTACREVFIRACGAGSHLGTKQLLESFVSDSDNPFVRVLQDTIKSVLGVSV